MYFVRISLDKWIIHDDAPAIGAKQCFVRSVSIHFFPFRVGTWPKHELGRRKRIIITPLKDKAERHDELRMYAVQAHEINDSDRNAIPELGTYWR